MQHYRFYLMTGTHITRGEDASCTGDDDAGRQALRRLLIAEAGHDAIEVWQDARLICRRERLRAAAN